MFDAYVISPAARYQGQPGLLYSDWIRPFIVYQEGPEEAALRFSDVRNGINDVNSKFWDRWGRHYFIVDPKGMVRDAYVSMNTQNHELQAMRSIVQHLGIDKEEVIFPEFNPYGRYSARYSPNIEGQFHNTMNVIDKGLRGE
jgi:hypothetical protein